MSPYDTVLQHYKFPDKIIKKSYQVETVNELCQYPRAGCYLGVGTGKTFVSTMWSLFKTLEHGNTVNIVLMPPILIDQWHSWIHSVLSIDKPSIRALQYVGSPKKRSEFDLSKFDYILMSMQVYKNDADSILDRIKGRKIVLLVDEATSIKNVASGNYKAVKKLVVNHEADFMPLTGTPLSTPLDGYAFIKLISPQIYRNLNQFENIHVESRDFFGTVTEWRNLDLLKENLGIHSVRLQRREVNTSLPPIFFDPVEYQLETAHYKLYKQLVEQQILELPDGGKIDATGQNALYHKTQQIVCNWDHFSGDDSKIASGFQIIDSLLSELGNEKVVVVGNYRLTNAKLVDRLAKYNAVAAYGAVPSKQQMANKERFINDPECRIFILQPSSAGYGMDGLQDVCSNMLFLELPTVPRDFHQTVGRLDRDGQKNAVQVKIAVALGTVQPSLLHKMLNKDELIGKVQPNVHNLRKELFGVT